ncbi:MAG: hypothetical protein ACOCVM_08575 [Desulfovibrionaceae bacterium]
MTPKPRKNRILLWPVAVLVLGLGYLFLSYHPEKPYITLIQALALAGLVFLAYRRSKRNLDQGDHEP